MKIGAFFLLERPAPKTDGQVFREMMEQVHWAEELGYDEVWLAEHHFSEYGIGSSLAPIAAAIARETQRVRIGTAVSILPFDHPLRQAEAWATVDVLSNGRLDFGVGRGYQPTEFAGFGVDMNEATDRFSESIEIIRKAWTEESFSYEGRFYQVKDLSLYPKPVQQPHPPMYIAALQPASFERAGRLGLGVLATPLITPLEMVKSNLELYRQALRESGGDPDAMEYPMQQMVYVGETNEEAKRFATPYFEWYYSTISRLVAPKREEDVAESYRMYKKSQAHLAQVTMDFLWENKMATLGDPIRVAEIVNMVRRELGMNHMLCWVGVGGMPHEKVMRSMELLKKEVLPRIVEPEPAVESALAHSPERR